METSTNTKKRKRSARKKEKGLLLLSLPRETFRQVLSFLPHVERLPLAATCSAALDHVETYSKDVVEKIRKQHRVDDTFEDRIRSLFESELGDDYSSRQLPQRLCLWAALKTFLYTYKNQRRPICATSTVVKLSPSEKFLLTKNRNEIRLWDTETRKSLRHINIFHALDVFFCGDGLIVICSFSTISVWSRSGELKYNYRTPEGYSCMKDWVVLKEKLIFLSLKTNCTTLRMLDIPRGTETVLDTLIPEELKRKLLSQPSSSLSVIDDRWLVAKTEERAEDQESRLSNFYVLDVVEGGFEQVGCHRSDKQYHFIPQPREHSTNLVAHRRAGVDIFKFNPANGQFSPCFSFNLPSNLSRVLGVHGQCLHLQGGGHPDFDLPTWWAGDGEDNPKPTNVMLHNIETGQAEGSYCWHHSLGEGGASQSVYSKDKQIVFVGIRVFKEDHHAPRRGAIVAAFLSKEPCLDIDGGAITQQTS